jgi:energy-converting hydrogenase Eha subunit H
MNKKFSLQFVLGIIVALIGAGIMFHGNIFGENNSGIATIIGIIGIGIIATSNIWNLKK